MNTTPFDHFPKEVPYLDEIKRIYLLSEKQKHDLWIEYYTKLLFSNWVCVVNRQSAVGDLQISYFVADHTIPDYLQYTDHSKVSYLDHGTEYSTSGWATRYHLIAQGIYHPVNHEQGIQIHRN